MWVRKPRSVAGAALGDVNHSLRVTECGFQRRRQLPCVAADRLGEAETLQEGEPAPLLIAVFLLSRVLRYQRAGGQDSVGTGPAEECPVELRELDPLYRPRPARLDLPTRPPAEGLRGELPAARPPGRDRPRGRATGRRGRAPHRKP